MKSPNDLTSTAADIPEVLPVEETDRGRGGKPPRRPILEMLLDPRNIQWLLGFGGVMLVAGLVLYLYAIGFFENPRVVAALMGTATVGVLFGGWVVLRKTRHQMAGRALTLLACLVMPLNLWFYHAQDLHPLTLYEQLWVAALVCCALYAVSALVLRDARFVYVFVTGIVGTCLLIMADVQGADFWQITYPAIMLVAMGLVTLHVERVFPPREEGDFTRRTFGMPFFWAGHVVLGLGLLMVLGAQVYGFLYHNDPWLVAHGYPYPAPITYDLQLQVLALLLVLGGTYAYVYSDLLVRRVGAYLYLALITVLWAEILVFDLLQIPLTAERAILVLAGTGVAAHLILPRLRRASEPPTGWSYAGYPIALTLSIAPVLLGVWLHFRYLLFRPAWETHELGWTYAGAMLLAAVSCSLGAKLYRQFRLSLPYLFAAGASLLVAAAGTLAALGVQTWEGQAPVLMLIPLLYLAVARLLRNDAWERPMLWLAHAATAVMLASSLVALVETAASPEQVVVEAVAQGFFLKRGVVLNLSLAAFFAEASLFYGLVAAYRKQAACVYLAAATACAAIWQLLSFARVDDLYYIVTFAVVGLTLLFACRLLALDRVRAGLTDTAFRAANALMSLSFAGGVLLTLAHLAVGAASKQYPLLGMLGVLMIVGLLAVVLVSRGNWRRIYACATIAQPVLALIVLAVLSQLTPWQKLEVVTVVLGAGLLVLGHVGWYRERAEENDLVTFSLFLGSLLVSVALISGVVSWRTMDVFHWPDELGLLAAGIILFLTGIVFRLKSTTLAGIVQLMVYVATLLIYLPWSQWDVAAILLMVSGGAVFVIGLLLSVFRDRLLALPQQIRERQSIFRVLTWR